MFCVNKLKAIKEELQKKYEQEAEARLNRDRDKICTALQQRVHRSSTSISLVVIGSHYDETPVESVHPLNLPILAEEFRAGGFEVEEQSHKIIIRATL